MTRRKEWDKDIEITDEGDAALSQLKVELGDEWQQRLENLRSDLCSIGVHAESLSYKDLAGSIYLARMESSRKPRVSYAEALAIVAGESKRRRG